jgi:glycosyltransferase involved in cell wall biosynthesis
VIPTYDRPDLLAEALESALAQTFEDIEVIVIDDSGRDEIHGVLADFSDTRLQYIRNSHNLGMVLAHLAGFERARGNYVAVLHDDDRWHPDLLRHLVPPLEADRRLSVAFSDHWIIDGAGRIDLETSDRFSKRWGRSSLASGVHRPFVDLALVRRSVPIQVAAVVRRSAVDLGNFPPEVGSCWDLWLCHLASQGDFGAYYEPQRLAYYRVHDRSETQGQRLRFGRSAAVVFGRLAEDDTLHEHRHHFKFQFAESCSTWGIGLLREGDIRTARHVLLTGIRSRLTARGAGALCVAGLPSSLARPVARGLRRRGRGYQPPSASPVA